jgi:membrane protease YdiL (CAAX protease family)
VKNIVLFVAGVLAIAWASNFAASRLAPGDPAIASLGVSIGGLGPLVVATLLRLIGRQGWGNAGLRFNFKQHRRWYLLGVLFTPAVLLVVAAIALVVGVAQVTPDRAEALRSALTVFAALALPMTLLSIGEEFGWRGYLEPALLEVNPRVVVNHVLVGVVWGVWHFPILLFAPESETTAAELAMVLIGCVALAVVYGQMRLTTDSVWPCVILHAVSNSLMISVGSAKLLVFDEAKKGLVSFNTTSVAVTGVWVVASLLVLWRGQSARRTVSRFS